VVSHLEKLLELVSRKFQWILTSKLPKSTRYTQIIIIIIIKRITIEWHKPKLRGHLTNVTKIHVATSVREARFFQISARGRVRSDLPPDIALSNVGVSFTDDHLTTADNMQFRNTANTAEQTTHTAPIDKHNSRPLIHKLSIYHTIKIVSSSTNN